MLQRIPVFGGVAEDSLRHILDRVRTVIVPKDDYYFRENDRAQSMFVLVEGRVVVVKILDGFEYELRCSS